MMRDPTPHLGETPESQFESDALSYGERPFSVSCCGLQGPCRALLRRALGSHGELLASTASTPSESIWLPQP